MQNGIDMIRAPGIGIVFIAAGCLHDSVAAYEDKSDGTTTVRFRFVSAASLAVCVCVCGHVMSICTCMHASIHAYIQTWFVIRDGEVPVELVMG